MEIIEYNKTNWEDFLNITDDVIIRVEDNIMVVSSPKGQAIINLSSKNIFNNHNLPYPYKQVYRFRNGVAIVINKDNSYSLITTDQRKIATYQYIDYLGDDLYRVRTNNKFGLINNQGIVIVPIKYDKIFDFEQGYAKVVLSGLYGLINKQGKEVIPPIYEDISEIKDGKVIATKGKKGLVSVDGESLIDTKYLDINFTYDNQLIAQKSKNKYLKINYEGNKIKNLHLRKYSVEKIKNGYILVYPNLLFSVDFTSKLLDSDGEEIEKDVYNYFSASEDKIIIKTFDKGAKLINSTKTIQSKYYKYITKLTNNRLLTQAGQINGLIDGEGKEILKPIYWDIKLITEDLFLVSTGSIFCNKLINSQEEVLASYKIGIGQFHKGYAIFDDEIKTGLINIEGKEIYASNNKITKFYRKGSLIIIYYSDHLDLIDLNGKKILENVRERIYILNDQQLIINGALVDIESLKVNPVYYVPELDKFFSTKAIAREHIEKHKTKSKGLVL